MDVDERGEKEREKERRREQRRRWSGCFVVGTRSRGLVSGVPNPGGTILLQRTKEEGKVRGEEKEKGFSRVSCERVVEVLRSSALLAASPWKHPPMCSVLLHSRA
ncbi:hypothetical protein H6P81_001687 [Aristolochia fimbriata]|uniref:Uncharacterized protein n=1 Tax=Aristolochia fimbriata TaxID=158543 RepID=A0AAV7F996_ARIFI|nr:hypothetical protein H6P81_001687 [Aristolochia fimbriata]